MISPVYIQLSFRFSQRKWEQQKRNSNNNETPAPNPDVHLIARSHFDGLSRYFVVYLARGVYLTTMTVWGLMWDVVVVVCSSSKNCQRTCTMNLSGGRRIGVRINVCPLPSPAPFIVPLLTITSCMYSLIPPRPRRLPPKTKSSLSETGYPAHVQIRRSVYFKLTRWYWSSKKMYSSFLPLQYPTR